MTFPHSEISREVAMKYWCPGCKAAPGEPCMGRRKVRQERISVHRIRQEVAARERKKHNL